MLATQMFIRLGYEMVFDVPAPTPMLLNLYVHPERAVDLHEPEVMTRRAEDSGRGFYRRLRQSLRASSSRPKGCCGSTGDMVIDDTGELEPGDENAIQHRVEDLPTDDVLQFFMGSRYCETDRMSDIAWQLFGQTPPGYRRVQAICAWLQKNIEFGYKYARSTKTAYETYQERTAVCRDFMHLACTFCRCLNIPARYATGYLGDIGVPAGSESDGFLRIFRSVPRWEVVGV